MLPLALKPKSNKHQISRDLKKIWALIIGVLVLDQALKIWIKTNLVLGEEIHVFDWFILHFTENNGMAFGLELGGVWGKVALTLFRLAAIGGLIYLMKKLELMKAPKLMMVSFGLITAGAAGNIIDSVFYGQIFNDSYGQIASFFPEEGGYAPLFQGKVVDMFYFPLFKGYLPEWIPFKGGDYFIFFRPVFNLADTAISVGVLILLIFQRNAFTYLDSKKIAQAGKED